MKGKIMENMVVQQKFKNGKVIEYTLEELGARVLPTTIINARYVKFNGKYRIQPIFEDDKTPELLGEKWKEYEKEYLKNRKIRVSNLGRVEIDGKIAAQMDECKLTGKLFLKDYPQLGLVYKLVAETWLECDPKQQKEFFDENGWDVHHITNDGYDNRPENLIWIKRELHNLIPKSK